MAAGKFHHEQIYRGADVLAKLSALRVVLCGAGAVGSNLADNLVRQGLGNLRVIDHEGEQVADLYAFQDGNHACSLSSGRSIDYASKIYLTTGDVLYANDSQRMFTIVADTVGRHDFLLKPCSQP